MSISLEIWKERIQIAEKETEKWRDDIHRFKEYYGGDFGKIMNDTDVEPLDQITVNIPYRNIKFLMNNTYARNPEVMCKSYSTDKVKSQMAIDAQDLLNNTINDINMNFKREIRKTLFDAAFGDGVIKFGYSFDTVEIELTPEEYEKMDEPNRARIKKLKSNIGKEIPVVDEKIIGESIWAKKWNSLDVIVDPEASSPDLTDARWIAFRKYIRLEETKDIKFDKRKVKKYSAAKDSQSQDWNRAIMYEVWDKEHKKRIVFFEESNEMLEEDWLDSYDLAGFPCEMLFFNEFTNFERGISGIKFYEPQIKEKNLIRTQQANHRRRFNRQRIYDKGALSKEQLKKAVKNIDGAWIEANNSAKVTVLQDAPLSQDVPILESKIDTDIADIDGQGENQRGAMSNKRTTATEVSVVENRARQGTSDKLDIVEQFLQRVMFKLYIFMRKNYSVERVSQIIGRPPIEWENLSKDTMDIKKQLNFSIKVNSTAPKEDKSTEIQQLIQIMTILTNQGLTIQTPVGQLVAEKLLGYLGENDVKEILVQSGQMAQQMLAQQQSAGNTAVVPTKSNQREQVGRAGVM